MSKNEVLAEFKLSNGNRVVFRFVTTDLLAFFLVYIRCTGSYGQTYYTDFKSFETLENIEEAHCYFRELIGVG